MSDNGYDDDDLNQDDNTGGGLRKQLEDLAKKVKAAETRAAAAESKLGEQAASKILSAEGYKPSQVKWATAAGVDLNDEVAVKKWLTDNADDLVREAKQTGDDESLDADSQQEDTQDGEQVSAYNAIGQIHATAVPATRNKYQAAALKLTDKSTKEEVRAAYAGL